jgi:hypothetical protein
MSDTALILQPKIVTSFSESSFIGSLDAIENFFETIEGTVSNLSDEQLLNLFGLVDELGTRSWSTRALVLEEIENRTKKLLNKDSLSKAEFGEHVAKVVNIAKSTAYEDIHILKSVRASGLKPRLDRTFYKIALGAPNFKEAVEHAEEEYDSLGGKYSTREFEHWVGVQKGTIVEAEIPTEETVGIEVTREELLTLISAFVFYLKNNPNTGTDTAANLHKKLTNRIKQFKE